MQPIQALLNRIRWDPEFGKQAFSLAYYDRLINVALREISMDPQDHFSFQLIDEEGECHHIPLHRIKAVYKNGEVIWQRAYPQRAP